MDAPDSMIPRITIRDRDDAVVLLEALSCYGQHEISRAEVRSSMAAALGLESDAWHAVQEMIALTERLVGFAEIIRAEIDRIVGPELDTDASSALG